MWLASIPTGMPERVNGVARQPVVSVPKPPSTTGYKL